MNFDEIVVYKEEAVLPYAIVEYTFLKKGQDTSAAVPTPRMSSPVIRIHQLTPVLWGPFNCFGQNALLRRGGGEEEV